MITYGEYIMKNTVMAITVVVFAGALVLSYVYGLSIKCALSQKQYKDAMDTYFQDNGHFNVEIDFIWDNKYSMMNGISALADSSVCNYYNIVFFNNDAQNNEVSSHLSCPIQPLSILQQNVDIWLQGGTPDNCLVFGNDALQIFALKSREFKYCPGFEQDSGDISYQRAVFMPALPYNSTNPNSFILEPRIDYSVMKKSDTNGIAICSVEETGKITNSNCYLEYNTCEFGQSNCLSRSFYCGEIRDDISFTDGTPVTVEDVAISAMFYRMLASSTDANDIQASFCPNQTPSIFRFSLIEEVITHDTYLDYIEVLSDQDDNTKDWFKHKVFFRNEKSVCFAFAPGVINKSVDEQIESFAPGVVDVGTKTKLVNPQIESFLTFPVFKATYHDDDTQNTYISGIFSSTLQLGDINSRHKVLKKYFTSYETRENTEKRLDKIMTKAFGQATHPPTLNEKNFFRTIQGSGAYIPSVANEDGFVLHSNEQLRSVHKEYLQIEYSSIRRNQKEMAFNECEKNGWTCVLDGVVEKTINIPGIQLQLEELQTLDPSFVGLFMSSTGDENKKKCVYNMFHTLQQRDDIRAKISATLKSDVLEMSTNPGDEFPILGLIPDSLREGKTFAQMIAGYPTVPYTCNEDFILGYYVDEPFAKIAELLAKYIPGIKVKQITSNHDQVDVVISSDLLYTSASYKSLISFLQENTHLFRSSGDISSLNSFLTKEQTDCAMYYYWQWEKSILGGAPPWLTKGNTCSTSTVGDTDGFSSYLFEFEKLYKETYRTVFPLYYFKPKQFYYNTKSKSKYWILKEK